MSNNTDISQNMTGVPQRRVITSFNNQNNLPSTKISKRLLNSNIANNRSFTMPSQSRRISERPSSSVTTEKSPESSVQSSMSNNTDRQNNLYNMTGVPQRRVITSFNNQNNLPSTKISKRLLNSNIANNRSFTMPSQSRRISERPSSSVPTEKLIESNISSSSITNDTDRPINLYNMTGVPPLRLISSFNNQNKLPSTNITKRFLNSNIANNRSFTMPAQSRRIRGGPSSSVPTEKSLESLRKLNINNNESPNKETINKLQKELFELEASRKKKLGNRPNVYNPNYTRQNRTRNAKRISNITKKIAAHKSQNNTSRTRKNRKV
jgi:hypothetical protein